MGYNTHEIGQFLDAVASPSVAPAGGSVAALVGAFGTSLAEMAAIHTRQKHGDESVNSELTLSQERLAHQRSVLVTLADEDARTVESLFTDSDGTADQTIVNRAAGVPLTIAESCANVLEESLDIATHVDSRVAPDLHTGLFLTVAAYYAAIRTVEINLELIEDTVIRAELLERVTDLERSVSNTMDQLEATTDVEFFG